MWAPGFSAGGWGGAHSHGPDPHSLKQASHLSLRHSKSQESCPLRGCGAESVNRLLPTFLTGVASPHQGPLVASAWTCQADLHATPLPPCNDPSPVLLHHWSSSMPPWSRFNWGGRVSWCPKPRLLSQCCNLDLLPDQPVPEKGTVGPQSQCLDPKMESLQSGDAKRSFRSCSCPLGKFSRALCVAHASGRDWVLMKPFTLPVHSSSSFCFIPFITPLFFSEPFLSF